MKQVLFGRAASPSTTTAEYSSLTGIAASGYATEAVSRHPWAAAGVFRNLVVELATAPGAGKTRVFALRINGATTALTCTISDTATTARLTGTDVSVAAGDLVALVTTPTGTPATTARVYWSLEFEGTTAKESAYGAGVGGTNSVARQSGVFAFAIQSTMPTTHAPNVVAAAGTLTATYAAVSSAPGVGNGFTFYVNLNGTRQDGAGATVNTACALTGAGTTATATYSLPLVASDLVYMEAIVSGSFSTRNWALGTRFVATTDGQAQACGSAVTPSTTVPSYSDAIGVGSAPGTVESVYDLAGVTTVRLSGLCVNLAAAPGSGKSRTLTLRKNAASVTSTVTISDLATTGTDSTHSDTIADGDHFNVSFQPTGTPAAADHRWAFVQEVVTAASGETAQPFVILPV